MKYKTTKKAINNGFNTVICVGYCNLQHLLNYESASAYTARAEGWAADVYEFGGVAIVTGYAPFGNVRPSYDVIRRYDDQARGILYETRSYETRDALRSLIDAFIEEVTA